MPLEKKCIRCHTPLTKGNIYEGFIKKHHFVCKDCWRKQVYQYRKNPDVRMKQATYMKTYMKTWISQNKEHWLQIQREYKRRNYLTINGKTVRASKRLRPKDDCCELCRKQKNILHYHHWDDENLSKGVWVCGSCHLMITAVENPTFEMRLNQYLELKQQIEHQV